MTRDARLGVPYIPLKPAAFPFDQVILISMETPAGMSSVLISLTVFDEGV
jgi:hypothetical protein